MSDKPLRTCTRCGQTDDHPRHVVSGPTPANFHMDCHALMGCAICVEQIKDAGGVQGEQLQTYLLEKDPLTDEQITELLGQTPVEG